MALVTPSGRVAEKVFRAAETQAEPPAPPLQIKNLQQCGAGGSACQGLFQHPAKGGIMKRWLGCILLLGGSLAAQTVQSTLLALKDPHAARKVLSNQLVDEMMRIAKSD